MRNKKGVKWSREEIILALDLYCKTPFNKISQNNPKVIELANLLGRTPGSVGLKMHNLAHHDPELKKRNIAAMAHGSKLDGEVFTEFCNNWTELAYQAQVIRAKLQHTNLKNLIELNDVEQLPIGEYREQEMKIRVGQYFFRMAVLNSYNNRCCITGICKSELLIASHIKPWRDCNQYTERTNPQNGLCLNPLHDKAFDKGLITINSSYDIVVSNQLKDVEMDQQTREWFWGYEGKQIILPDKFLPAKNFIEYHNDVVFLG